MAVPNVVGTQTENPMAATRRNESGDAPARQQGPAKPHVWLKLKVGRVCELCQRTQATGEFDDTPDCPGHAQA